MYYNNARRYSPVMLSRQRVAARVYPGTAESGLSRQVMVWAVAASMILVLFFCLGLGFKLERDQTELLLQRGSQRQLELMCLEMTVKRDQLISKQNIAKAVKKMGLSAPVGNQVVKL